MMWDYARTREREKAWKMGAFCLGGSFLAAPIVAHKDRPFAFTGVKEKNNAS